MEPIVPNNSDKAREEKPRTQSASADPKAPQKVVEGKVIQRKKPFRRRLLETFIAGEVGSIKDHLIFDVIVPAIRDAITNTIIEGVDRTFNGSRAGGVRHTPRRSPVVTNYTNYNRASSSPVRREEPRTMTPRGRANHDFNEIILESHAEAMEVLDRMQAALEEYGTISVANLYTFLGITPSFVDERWGWIDLRTAGVSRLGQQQYLLNLPDPEPIRS